MVTISRLSLLNLLGAFAVIFLTLQIGVAQQSEPRPS